MQISRRGLMLAATAFVPVALTGCGQTVAQWAADAQVGLNAIRAAITALPASAAKAIPSVVSSGLMTLSGLFGSIAKATPSTATTLAGQLLVAGEEALPVIASFFGPYGAAAMLAVSGIEAIINAISNDVAAGSSTAAAVKPLALPFIPTMTPADARKKFG